MTFWPQQSEKKKSMKSCTDCLVCFRGYMYGITTADSHWK